MRPGRRPLLAAAALAALAAGCAARGDSAQLELRSPAWALGGFGVELDVRPRGALARRDVGLTVLLNGNELGRFGTETGVARVELPATRLQPGINRVIVKTGNTRASLELRVVPRWQAAVAVALVAGVGLAVARRGRRRSGAA